MVAQAQLLALARYARQDPAATRRHLMALEAFWVAASDTDPIGGPVAVGSPGGAVDSPEAVRERDPGRSRFARRQ